MPFMLTRQAFYIKWCTIMGINDPCGHKAGWERILAIYAKYVMTGTNWYQKQNVRSGTVRSYVLAASELFTLRGFDSPVDLNDKTNWVTIIISNLEREEDIAKQRNPLTCAICAELKRMADASHVDSAERLIFNITAFGRITGPRVSEYAQTSPDKVDIHRYPSGKEVIKAFIAEDFEFFDKKGNPIVIDENTQIDMVKSMRVRWRIQKNRQNGQKLKLQACRKSPDLCAVRNAIQIVLRKIRLRHDLDLPLAIYVDKKGEIKYLTAKKVAEVFRKAAKKTCSNTFTSSEVMKNLC